jgi:NAD(P)-dependent dehydrogenase (short-subunit alcohol dehydrogenase family)
MAIVRVVPTDAREPELVGQTVVVIRGSAGIGLQTARRARAEGADVILTGRDPDRLRKAATELGAVSTAAFDANDPAALEAFFGRLEGPLDHVMVTAGGPYYATLADMDFDEARRKQLRDTLPIGRVVGPADVAALAVHIMSNTALTGATFDIDGGEQFVIARGAA